MDRVTRPFADVLAELTRLDAAVGTSIRIKSNGCWEWTGCKTLRGYGRVRFQGKNTTASRMVWHLVNGDIPSGMFVCHRCDNPPCVNPAHLFLGTQKENMADCVAKGRIARTKSNTHIANLSASLHRHFEAHGPTVRGEHVHGSKLTEQDVVAILRATDPQRVVAARYGVSQSLVGMIKRRIIWRHVNPSALAAENQPRAERGEENNG